MIGAGSDWRNLSPHVTPDSQSFENYFRGVYTCVRCDLGKSTTFKRAIIHLGDVTYIIKYMHIDPYLLRSFIVGTEPSREPSALNYPIYQC